MESLRAQLLAPVVTGQRTSIPLRSILNDEEGRDCAENVQPRTLPSEAEIVKVDKTAVQRSQFLFINTSNASRPSARLRQDQKVINAHVQHTSHRQRRAAAMTRLKRTVRLCPYCAQSKADRRVKDPKRESSPSSSASESSLPNAEVGHGPLPRPPQKSSYAGHVCSQCGASLQSTGDSRNGQHVRRKNIATASPITTALASSKEQASPVTLFVVDQPTSFLDSSMLDPFSTSSVPLNMDMNGVLLHCKCLESPSGG